MTIEPPAAMVEVAEPRPAPHVFTGRDFLLVLALIFGITLFGNAAVTFLAFFRSGFDPAAVRINAIDIVLITFVTWALSLYVLWIFYCRNCSRSIADSFALRPVSGVVIRRSVIIGLIGVAAATGLSISFGTGESTMGNLVSPEAGEGAGATLTLTLMVAMIVLVPPLEEMYYRGFLYPVIRRWVGPIGSVCVVSVWFALPHIPQIAGDWIALPIIFTMGVIWAIQRMVHDSIVPSMVSHLTYNGCLAGLMVLGRLAN